MTVTLCDGVNRYVPASYADEAVASRAARLATECERLGFRGYTICAVAGVVEVRLLCFDETRTLSVPYERG